MVAKRIWRHDPDADTPSKEDGRKKKEKKRKKKKKGVKFGL